MRIKIKSLLSIALLFSILSCANHEEVNLTKATIKTNMGDIEFVLLNETRLHKENFIEMVNQGFYNDIQFHRVIKNFVIQTGNQNSINLDADSTLLDGGAEHLINEEIIEKFHHTRGAVGAAREGDEINPVRSSSGSHFYIVQGNNFKRLTETTLDKNNITDPKIRQEYLKNGGEPHLDGGYTIFGYVVAGMDVVDSIANVETNSADRPLKNMIIKEIELSEVDKKVFTENPLYEYLNEQ